MKAIYCAGEQGRVTLDILHSMEQGNEIVFVDDNQAVHGESIQGYPIIGSINSIPDPEEEKVECLVAFGDKQEVRLEIADKIADRGYSFFNAVHHEASVSKAANIGTGVIINAQTYIGPDVTINNHVLIDSSVNISHDCEIERGVTITPGAVVSGGVSVKKDAYIGPNATITENVKIGEKAVIGAGAVVTDDVQAETTVVGVPASPIN